MANLIQIDTTGCNSDYRVSLPAIRTVGKYITVKDNGKNPSFFASNSIIIVSGQPFFGGSTAEYIVTSRGSLSFITTTSSWRLLNSVPYTTLGEATLSNISTTHLLIHGDVFNYDALTIGGVYVSSMDAQVVPTIHGEPIISTSNIVSTVAGLGSSGFLSSVSGMNESFISTLDNLGSYGYISTAQIQSTIQGLGTSGYISANWLTSTIQGMGSTYISSPSLTSTAQGLGGFGFISSSSLTSTMQALGTNGYISTSQLTSTVSNMFRMDASNYLSTFNTIGSTYISSSSLRNTIQNLGLSYVSKASFNSTVIGVTDGYMSNLTSSVSGFGSLGYISTLSLFSTTEGIQFINESNVSTAFGKLSDTYIPKTSMQSTVVGLASLPFRYISTSSLVSTMTGLTGCNISDLTSSVVNMGQYYISRAALVSSVTDIVNRSASNITSTINGLGQGPNGYISTASLQSTIDGLSSSPYKYICTSQLTSTTTGLSNAVNYTNSTIIGLGSVGYVSAPSLTSTIQSLGSLTFQYISTASLVSTVQGLGTFGYISRETLNITTNTLASFNDMPSITSTFSGLGSVYISTAVIDVYQVTTVPRVDLSEIGAITNALVAGSAIGVTTTTFAGSSSGSSNGQEGTFAAPRGVVLDSGGNVYVSDSTNFSIRRITPSGNVSTYAGSGTGGSNDGNGVSASFSNPFQLAIDPFDNIYVADAGNHKIRKIDRFRNVTTFAGSGTAGEVDGQGTSATFNTPSAIAFDPAGFLYVSGLGNKIRLITPTGYVTTYAGTGSAGSNDGQWNVATFSNPRSLAFGSNVIYMADSGNNKIRSITETRTVSTYSPSNDKYNYSTSIDFDISGNMYVADIGNHVIWKVTNNGATVTVYAGSSGNPGWVDGTSTDARFNEPVSIVVDVTGSIFITEGSNQRIRYIDKYGNVSTIAGKEGSSSTDGVWHNASFHKPYGIALNSLGILHVSENMGHKIKKIFFESDRLDDIPVSMHAISVDSSSNIYTIYSTGGVYGYAKYDRTFTRVFSNTSPLIKAGFGIAVDSSSNIYISDIGTTTTAGGIFKVTADGATISSYVPDIGRPKRITFFQDTLYVAATNQVGKIVSGVTTTTTLIGDGYANSIAIDSSGNIFMTLPYYNQVRKYSSAGTLLTTYGDPANSSVNTFGLVNSATASTVRFKEPTGIAVASTGNVYIADKNNHVIRKITPSGVTSTFAGDGESGFIDAVYLSARFKNPHGIAVDENEYVYVTDSGNHAIRKLADGYVTSYAGPSVAYGKSNLQSAGNVIYALGTATLSEDFPGGGVIPGTPLTNATAAYFIMNASGGIPRFIFTKIYVREPTTAIAAGVFPDNGYLQITGMPNVVEYTGTFSRTVTLPVGYITISMGYTKRPGSADNRACGVFALFRESDNYVLAKTDTTWFNDNGAGSQAAGGTENIGSWTSGYSNGSVDIARFNNPCGITYLSGNLYVADLGNNAIRKITSSAVTTVAGLGPASPGRLNGSTTSATFTSPYAIAINGANLYVTENTLNDIRQINLTTNQVSTLSPYTSPNGIGFNSSGTMRVVENGNLSVASSVSSPVFEVIASNFTNAVGICVHSSGIIYVADFNTSQIHKIDTSSNVSLYAGSAGAGLVDGPRATAKFNKPYSLAMIGDVMYVADSANNLIRYIYNEVVTQYVKINEPPIDIALDSSGILQLIAGSSIIKFARMVRTVVGSGTAGFKDATGTAANFNGMYFINFDRSDNLYVADLANYRVRKVDTASNVTTLAGSGYSNFVNGPSTTAQLNPLGVYIDSNYFVYVTDYLTGTIRLIYPDGYVTSIAGTGVSGLLDGAAANAMFKNPRGIYMYASNIYVTDVGNKCIRKISLSRTVATFAGSGVAGSTNGANLSATFNNPQGIAVDRGNIYVSDSNAHDIRKISGGQVTLYAGSSAGTSGFQDGTSALFRSPTGITTDPAGNVYVADQSNTRIRKIYPATDSYVNTIFYANPTSVYKLPLTTLIPESFVTDQTKLYGMTCDRTYIYATCGTMVKSIHMITGVVTTIAGTAIPGSANGKTQASVGFDNLQSIAIDPTFSNLYVCDFNNQKVRKIQLNPLSVTTQTGLVNPIGIAIDSYGTYAYVTTSMNELHKVSLLRQDVSSFVVSVAGYPKNISLDPTNTYAYITCVSDNVIRQVNLKTISETIIAGSGAAASVDGAGTAASFHEPYDVVFNPTDSHLYSTDGGSGLLRRTTTKFFLSSMIGLTESKTVPTITANSSITNGQAGSFIYKSNTTITTTPNLYIFNNTINAAVSIAAGSNTVTAKTFTAVNGTAGGNNGYFFGDGTYITVTSDIRTKENIQPIQDALAIVRQLQAVEYTKIDDSRRWIGYIAQDVEHILPHIVRTDASPEQWKSIQYTYLPGLIIEALKELKAKIDAFESLAITV